MSDNNFLRTISDLSKIITPIDSTIRFPEVLDLLIEKYDNAIDVFVQIIKESESSAEVLKKIRTTDRDADERMALLKMYRRCVSPVLDTETTKKIKKISTDTLVEAYGATFKPIAKLKAQFSELPKEYKYALAALVGEYDTRGQLGYQLTGAFFDWFEDHFAGSYTIEGPRGAGGISNYLNSTQNSKVLTLAISWSVVRLTMKCWLSASRGTIPRGAAHSRMTGPAAMPTRSRRQKASTR